MTPPILKSILFSLMVFLVSPVHGQTVSNTIPLAAVVTNAVKVTWTWAPDPAQLGGLSTNDYATNVWFTIYTTTDVSSTNWTVWADNISASPWTGNYTAVGSIDSSPRFFKMRSWTVRDKSDFSNVLPYLHAGGSIQLGVGQ